MYWDLVHCTETGIMAMQVLLIIGLLELGLFDTRWDEHWEVSFSFKYKFTLTQNCQQRIQDNLCHIVFPKVATKRNALGDNEINKGVAWMRELIEDEWRIFVSPTLTR